MSKNIAQLSDSLRFIRDQKNKYLEDSVTLKGSQAGILADAVKMRRMKKDYEGSLDVNEKVEDPKLWGIPNIIVEVCTKADIILEKLLEQNSVLVSSKLSQFSNVTNEINKKAFDKDKPEMSVKGLIESSLYKFILQEYKLMVKKYRNEGDTSPISPEELYLYFTDEKLKKICEGILIEYYRALKISERFNLTPGNTATLLGNLYRIDPNNITKMLAKYNSDELSRRGVHILDSTIIQQSIKLNNADESLARMVEDYIRLKKAYQDNEHVTDSVIQRYINDSNPSDSIKKFLARVEFALSIPNIKKLVNPSLIRDLAKSNPDNYLIMLETFIKNIEYINSNYNDIQIGAEAKVFFALNCNKFSEIDSKIADYLENCIKVEGFSYRGKTFGEYGYGYIIRNKVRWMGVEKMEKYLKDLVDSTLKVLGDPKLPKLVRSKTTLENIVIHYGSKDLLEKCIIISEYHKRLTNFFKENNSLYREILEKYNFNFIRLSMISPVKTFEENRDFFAEKIRIFLEPAEAEKKRSGSFDLNALKKIYEYKYTINALRNLE